MDELKYPVGKFQLPQSITAEDRRLWIREIAEAPAQFRRAAAGLNETQLDTPYRPGGWTVRQVIHHVPDSHMHSFLRCKFALSEDQPTIKPYDEAAWAGLPDAKAPVEISLQLLEALHARWVALLQSLTDSQFARTFRHPELGLRNLDQTVALYAWHGRHHEAHITRLRDRMGW
jgi:hypothetical protein